MIGKFEGTIVGLVQTKAYQGRPPGGRIDFLVKDRDTQAVLKVKCDLEDLIALGEFNGKKTILDIDVNEYDITDEATKERKQGVSYKLWRPGK